MTRRTQGRACPQRVTKTSALKVLGSFARTACAMRELPQRSPDSPMRIATIDPHAECWRASDSKLS